MWHRFAQIVGGANEPHESVIAGKKTHPAADKVALATARMLIKCSSKS
jgi:hypothetical protein